MATEQQQADYQRAVRAWRVAAMGAVDAEGAVHEVICWGRVPEETVAARLEAMAVLGLAEANLRAAADAAGIGWDLR
jgi:hypothetical protein